MSSPSKIAALQSSPRGQLYRVAVVGAGTLKGKEVAEMLNERNFPAVDVRLLDDDESIGQLEATGDEINFIQSLRTEQFTNMDFTFFAADARTTRQNWKRARDAGSAIIDLSGALEEEAWRHRSLSLGGTRAWTNVAAGAAACSVRRRPSRGGDAGASSVASEQSRRYTELPRQQFSNQPLSKDRRAWTSCTSRPSICCLSKRLPKDVFDAQVAFNMVARYGPNSKLSLDSLEATRAPSLSENCRRRCASARALAASSLRFFMAMGWRFFWRWPQSVDPEEIVAGSLLAIT